MTSQERILQYLYHTTMGRRILGVLVKPSVSKVVGAVLEHKISCLLIPGFIRKNHIDMNQFEKKAYTSYNDFFTRKIRPGMRPIPANDIELFAPCDSRLLVYPISADATFQVKGTAYTLEQLLHSHKLAERYQNGWFLLFRLSVEDYHRYCYVDDGTVGNNYRIPGVFHTVNPIANECLPIYKENTREFSLLKSKHFGTVLMMEVGAMLVGRIKNHHVNGAVKRGQEKGYFEFGGSTVILCLQNGKATIKEEILQDSAKGIETKVKQGDAIGRTL